MSDSDEFSEAVDIPALRRLLAAGHSPDRAVQFDGRTLLHKASSSGDLPMVLTLLAAGATVDLPSNRGWTALHDAACAGHPEVVMALLRAGASTEALAASAPCPCS